MPNDEKYPPALEAHLKQRQEITERIRRQVELGQDLYESNRKPIQASVDGREAWQQLRDWLPAALELLRQITEPIRLPQIVLPDLSPIITQVVDVQKAIQASIGPALEEYCEAFRKLPTRTREALLLLGKHGWYFDPEMSLPDLWALKVAIDEGEHPEAETTLMEYFESHLTEIEQSIVTKFPHRSHLIRAAWDAHRRGEYVLSIPVLLAQTDGICKETVDKYLFMKKDKKPETASYVDQIAADCWRAAVLSPLAETLPIGASKRERTEGFTSLNRHTVLHGESLDYGNKINSLKAISLVNYVAHVLPSCNP